jgi:NDP-sugar pyrophosphorylase family protein
VNNSDVQVVIIAGGLGTRLGVAGRRRPKVLQPIDGRPFIEYLLEPLLEQGFRRFCFCLGHLGESVVDYLATRPAPLTCSTFVEPAPLGTAGALRAAMPLLDEKFLVVLGDTYLRIDYHRLWRRLTGAALGVMAVTDAMTELPGNVGVADGAVRWYDKAATGPGWVDTGALALRRAAVELLPDVLPIDLGTLFSLMISNGSLLAHETDQRFHDIGTLERLARFANEVSEPSRHPGHRLDSAAPYTTENDHQSRPM